MGTKLKSDKKRDIKPFISSKLKDSIYRLSYITNTPVKDVCEKVCKTAIKNKKVIEELSNYFHKNIRINSTFYMGNSGNPKIHNKKVTVKSERISVRLNKELYEFLHSLSYALDCSVAEVASILLEHGMNDITFISSYVNEHLHDINDKDKEELQKILDYINQGLEEEIGLASLLSYIVDEFKQPLKTIREAVNDFIEYWKSPQK